jgi:hypothetical protein
MKNKGREKRTKQNDEKKKGKKKKEKKINMIEDLGLGI